jgi:hypothetical protein
MSATKRILVVGAGGRVTDAVLPVLARSGARFELGGVFARRARAIDARGTTHRVRPLTELTAREVAATDVVYAVVAKPAVGAVLAQLARFDVAHVDLLLETPVVLFKHLHHARRARPFRSVSVAEDISALPWLDLVRRLTAPDGELGPPRRAELDRSGYAYHGVALAKALLGDEHVRTGVCRRQGGLEVRSLRFASGREAQWTSPRDYSLGAVTLACERGALSDRPAAGVVTLQPVLAAGRQIGIRAGDLSLDFDDDEAALCTELPAEASLTARMQDMKRIGLMRLLRSMHEGRGAYPLASGLDDMLVDYHLEKLGRYVANPFTSARGAARPLVDGALGLLARFRGH